MMTNLAYTDYEEEYDEFDPDEINSPEYVDYYFRRKADWEKRIQNLYAHIKGWLPKEVTSSHGVTPMLPDAMMKKFEPNEEFKFIRPMNFYNGLSIFQQMKMKENNKIRHYISPAPEGITEDKIGSIDPYYQWVAGNNGQLSFTSHKGDVRYNIIDRSEKRKYDFNPPVWVLSIFRNKYIEVPLIKKTFLTVLEEMSHAEAK